MKKKLRQALSAIFEKPERVTDKGAIVSVRRNAVEDGLGALVARSEVVWIDKDIYTAAAAARARQARERQLSLTDCASFEIMRARGCREFIGDDEDFVRQGFHSPG